MCFGGGSTTTPAAVAPTIETAPIPSSEAPTTTGTNTQGSSSTIATQTPYRPTGQTMSGSGLTGM